ncbi:MAG: NfeD family protein, partial [Cellulomonadaceae bacterium]|nr:NfeD family protein [Cellulomonadaceae bacterium]
LDSFEFLDFGCSSATIGTAFTVFGFVGEMVRQTHLPAFLVWAIASVLSLLVGFAVQRVINRLEKNESGVANYSIVGMQGEVTVRVTEKSGEVKLDDHRELESRLARMAKYKDNNLDIPKGTRVVVLEQKGVHAVVEPVATAFS